MYEVNIAEYNEDVNMEIGQEVFAGVQHLFELWGEG